MTLLPTGWIKMPGDNDETKRFAWSHVKSIFYNKAANVLLKDKLDEMDKIIDEKIAKALMSNVQVNDQSKIPTSALAYAMQQSITKNGQDIAKLNSDLKTLKKSDVQFSNGFAEISFPGLTYDSAVCINQEYKSSAGVQNLVFTAQVRPNELIIYARNANDGSSYNGTIHIMAIAIG